MKRLEVIKDNAFLALEKGDTFYFDEESGMHVYNSVEEDIGDKTYYSYTSKVMLSQDIIDNLIKVGVLSEVKEKEKCLCGKDEEDCVADDSVSEIDWEAYNLGLELKKMLNKNKN